MSDGQTIGGLVSTFLLGLLTMWVTRRGSKETTDVAHRREDRETFAVINATHERRIVSLERDLAEVVAEQKRVRDLRRAHEPWDDEVADQVRQLGGTIGPPPPLD